MSKNQNATTKMIAAVIPKLTNEIHGHCSGGRSNRVPTFSHCPLVNAMESCISIADRSPRIIARCISAISGGEMWHRHYAVFDLMQFHTDFSAARLSK